MYQTIKANERAKARAKEKAKEKVKHKTKEKQKEKEKEKKKVAREKSLEKSDSVDKIEIKHCPQCNVAIEHIGGCHHMTCSQCKYEFHWENMKKWTSYNANYGEGISNYPGVKPRPSREAKSKVLSYKEAETDDENQDGDEDDQNDHDDQNDDHQDDDHQDDDHQEEEDDDWM